ncbi:receptor-type tyrosine-protein phosphatase H-like [Polyodon spathula]|uniref:receptor-type tyrosine-protein phosphatase H-like n=1 Tax=Polyodon spathula TaxID=7913 RepID=UPI001B7F4658|nr:receptor-type tyrosine-protein phosphatase H-like [Polyodon spathula]
MDFLLWLFVLFTQLHVSDQQTTPADNTTTHMTTTTRVPTLPLPVSNLTVLPQSTTELHVNWSLPAGNKTGFIVSYNQTNIETKNITTNQTFVTLTDLDPGTIYEVTVKTQSNGQESSPVSSTGITLLDCAVQRWTITETSIAVEATVPIEKVTCKQPDSQESSCTGLSPGCSYNASIWVQDQIVCTEPQTLNPSPVSDITVMSKSTNQIKYHWTVPNNTRVAQYQYSVTLENVAPSSTDKNSYTANELKPGEKYTLCIESVTPEHTRSTPECLSTYTNPSAPVDLTASEDTTTALVSWSAPSSDVNYQNYTYLLSWSSSDLNGSKVISETSASLTALIPGSLYSVRVQSQIGDAQSVGESLSILTDPLPPTGLLVSAENETGALLKWGDPASGGYSGFQIFYSNTSSSTAVNQITQDVRQYKLTNLTPGECYNISLRSFKTEGGIQKNSTEEKTNFQTVPAQVSSLQCSAVSGGYSLLLNWGIPAGLWTAIEVDVFNGDKKKIAKCGLVQCETRIDGLSPAQYYTVSVTTVSGEKRSFRAVSIRCQTDTTGVIVGAVFGVLILICLVVFLVLFILRRYPDLLGSSSSSKDDVALEFTCKKIKPIEVSKFADYFHRQQADSDIGFAEEYQSLGAIGTEQTSKAALLPENRGKNRFTNVLPYDWCRVKLSAIDGDPFSDYINANFVPGYHTAKEFIAAQGPLPNTVEDFWRMAWENQVEAIVMLTNCVENSQVKCEQYWPLDYTPCTYGCISVTTSSEQKLPDWTLRDFTVKHTKSTESRTVRQFHFTAWPDHRTPGNTATLIQFRALVRKFLDDRKGSGPALVHCSAGVGRTGTLIALDSLLLQIEREKVVGIQSFVQKMRLHRPLMVQTESQYIFLNQCMLDTIQGKMNNSDPDGNIDKSMVLVNTTALGEFNATNENAA